MNSEHSWKDENGIDFNLEFSEISTIWRLKQNMNAFVCIFETFDGIKKSLIFEL